MVLFFLDMHIYNKGVMYMHTKDKHTILKILVTLFGIFTGMNCVLIYTFMELLKKV